MIKTYLGPGIIGEWGILPYSDLFNIAGYQHDIGYEKGGDLKDKKRVDLMFFKLMLAVSKTKPQIFFAYFYYYMVRIFGILFFNYNKMIEIKTTLTALVIASLSYLALPGEMLLLFVVLMLVDTFLRYISGHIYKDFSSQKARIGIISKMTLLLIPFGLAVMFKILELGEINSGYTKGVITGLIAVLAVGEFYSIIKNYIYLRTGEKPTEYDGITIILKKILDKIQKFLETYLK